MSLKLLHIFARQYVSGTRAGARGGTEMAVGLICSCRQILLPLLPTEASLLLVSIESKSDR